MTAPTVSVVIPNWNGRRFLHTCLQSLFQQEFADLEVVLVDNGSADDSVTFVQSEFPQVRLLAFPENRGFTGAVNAGIMASRGRYVFVLNNDTELDRGCVGALVAGIESGPDVASVGPKILDFQDRSHLGGIGDGYTFAGVPSSVGFLERDEGQFEEPIEIFSVSGCAALYRRTALDDVGLLDDDFFAYYEDVDLGFRLQMARYRCLYVPTALVYHVGSGTTGGRLNPFTVRQMAQNMVGLAVKNLPARVLLSVLPVWLTVQTLFLARIAVGSGLARRQHLVAYGQGLRAAARLFRRTMAKRQVTLARSRLRPGEVAALIRRSERMILASMLRARGPGWRWAPLVRLYAGATSRWLR